MHTVGTTSPLAVIASNCNPIDLSFSVEIPTVGLSALLMRLLQPSIRTLTLGRVAGPQTSPPLSGVIKRRRNHDGGGDLKHWGVVYRMAQRHGRDPDCRKHVLKPPHVTDALMIAGRIADRGSFHRGALGHLLGGVAGLGQDLLELDVLGQFRRLFFRLVFSVSCCVVSSFFFVSSFRDQPP